MVVVGFWLPVTLNILFNLVKSVSIVLSGQFFFGSGYFAVDGNLPSETILP